MADAYAHAYANPPDSLHPTIYRQDFSTSFRLTSIIKYQTLVFSRVFIC